MEYLVQVTTYYRFKDNGGNTRGRAVKYNIPAQHFEEATDLCSRLSEHDKKNDIHRECMVAIRYRPPYQGPTLIIPVHALQTMAGDIEELHRCYLVDSGTDMKRVKLGPTGRVIAIHDDDNEPA